MILTVDFAAKFSAAMVRGRDGTIHRQFDSRGLSSFQWLANIVRAALDYDVELIVIEDVPYGISSQAMVKPVLRLQGVLIALLGAQKLLGKTRFLNPSTWQKEYPGVGSSPRGLSKAAGLKSRVAAAYAYAAEYGYTPPDLIAEYTASLPEGTKILKKNTDPLEKVRTDYIDAFLMSHWIYSFGSLDMVKDIKGMQPTII